MTPAAVDSERAAMDAAQRDNDEARKLRIEAAFTKLETYEPGAGEPVRHDFHVLLRNMRVNRR